MEMSGTLEEPGAFDLLDLDYYYQTIYKDHPEKDAYVSFKYNILDPVSIEQIIAFSRTYLDSDKNLHNMFSYDPTQIDCVGTGCTAVATYCVLVYAVKYIYCGIMYETFKNHMDKLYLIPYYISSLSKELSSLAKVKGFSSGRSYNSLDTKPEEVISELFEVSNQLMLYMHILSREDMNHPSHHFFMYKQRVCGSWGEDRKFYVLYAEISTSFEEFYTLLYLLGNIGTNQKYLEEKTNLLSRLMKQYGLLNEACENMIERTWDKYFFNQHNFHFETLVRTLVTPLCIQYIKEIMARKYIEEYDYEKNPIDEDELMELIEKHFQIIQSELGYDALREDVAVHPDQPETEKEQCLDFMYQNRTEINDKILDELVHLDSYSKIQVEEKITEAFKEKYMKEKERVTEIKKTPYKDTLSLSLYDTAPFKHISSVQGFTSEELLKVNEHADRITSSINNKLLPKTTQFYCQSYKRNTGKELVNPANIYTYSLGATILFMQRLKVGIDQLNSEPGNQFEMCVPSMFNRYGVVSIDEPTRDSFEAHMATYMAQQGPIHEKNQNFVDVDYSHLRNEASELRRRFKETYESPSLGKRKSSSEPSVESIHSLRSGKKFITPSTTKKSGGSSRVKSRRRRRRSVRTHKRLNKRKHLTRKKHRRRGGCGGCIL